MGVTIVPNYAAQAAEALSSLGQSIGSIINPHQELQRNLRQMIALNPQLAPALADLGPEALKKIGLGDELIAAISSVAPTTQQIIDKATREGLGELEPGVIGEFGVARALGTTPTGLATEPRLAKEIRELPAEAIRAGATRAVTGQTPGEREQDRLFADIFPRAQQAVTNLLAGQKISPEQEGTIRFSLRGFFEGKDLLARMAHESALYKARTIQDFIEAKDRADHQNALDSFQASNRGSVQTWEMLFKDPAIAARARQLATGALIPESAQDIELKAVGEYQLQKDVSRRAGEFGMLDRQFVTAIKLFNGAKNDAEKAQGIESINRVLAQGHSLGAPLYTAQYGEPPVEAFVNPGAPLGEIGAKLAGVLRSLKLKTLYFTDASGRVAQPEKVQAAVQGMVEVGGALPAVTPGVIEEPQRGAGEDPVIKARRRYIEIKQRNPEMSDADVKKQLQREGLIR